MIIQQIGIWEAYENIVYLPSTGIEGFTLTTVCLSLSFLISSFILLRFPFSPVTDHNPELSYTFFVIWCIF